MLYLHFENQIKFVLIQVFVSCCFYVLFFSWVIYGVPKGALEYHKNKVGNHHSQRIKISVMIDQPTPSSSHRAPGRASLPARCPPSLQVCRLQWQMALASPVVPTHTFQWDFPLNSKQRTRLNSQSCKNVFKIVFHWSPVTSRAILCEFLRVLDKHIFWISSQVPGKISELCFDTFFLSMSSYNTTISFSGFQKWVFKTTGSCQSWMS